MGQNNIRKSAKNFCEQLNIKVLDFNGQFNDATFNNQIMTSEEFFNRISLCKIQKPDTKLSRRKAYLARQDLMNKLK